MAYHIDIKNNVINLRKRGYSLNELHKRTGVAKGTLSLWLRDIKLNETAKERLINKINAGRYKSAENKKAKTEEILKQYYNRADNEFKKIDSIPDKLICVLIYWCEGAKSISHGVNFTNSDPFLINLFLSSLRKSFKLDETKFRPCIHLHNYHDPIKQLNFWSKITQIPKHQFIRPYIKPNTGKRIREGYNGCIAIKYHDNDLAKQLIMSARAFLDRYKGV